MIPSVVATQIRNCVSDYLRTTFRPTTPGFEGLMDRFLSHRNNFYQGPYISIGLPFRTGTQGPDFFKHLPLNFHPHLHQEKAFQRLQPPYYQSTLIATGTGSGKTECFLIPLLEYCRQQMGERGIKAILIYPMNALATDQAKRIAALIHNSPNLKGKVTAGLYVGEQEDNPTTQMGPDKIITDKQTIRSDPPDILLTNYKMLDYLLIQPETQSLWKHNETNPESLRYLVVDEFHTFDGAQGTDLACLIRRLKHRLKTPDQHLACVGTSATLGSGENQREILDYAATIFAEPFDDNALIEEDRLTANEFLFDIEDINVFPLPTLEELTAIAPDQFSSPESYILAQAQLWLKDYLPAPPALSEEWAIALGHALKTLPIIQNLIRKLGREPQTYPELIAILSRQLGLSAQAPDHYYQLLLDSLISLIATARRPIQRPNAPDLIVPWVTLRVQYWFRELKRMVGTVESQPQLTFSDDQSHATDEFDEEETEKTLPILHCRDCGATGWGGVKPSQGANKIIPDNLRNFYQAFFGRSPLFTSIFPCLDHEPDFSQFCNQCLTLNSPGVKQCLSCGHPDLIRVHVPDMTYTETRNGQKRLMAKRDCPYCESRNGLSILGAQAASLTSAMIGVLYTTPYNTDKKLLTFSDSVQDAAHRAGFYAARTYNTTVRTAIAHTVARSPQGLTLKDLLEQFPEYWHQQIGSTANYIATFLPSDLAWLQEWDEFIQSDRPDLSPDTTLPRLLQERLTWEIVKHFGHRSAVGPSLERSGVCSVTFPETQITQAVRALHLKLTNEIEALRSATRAQIQQFILGLLHHLRQRGGILQPTTEQYIHAGGNTFLWSKLTYMPNIGPRLPRPIFFANASANADPFEKIINPGNKSSWSENWASRLFALTTLLLKEQLIEILHLTLDTLVDAKLLEIRPCNQGRAWGIPLSALIVSSQGIVLACDRCGHQITTSPQEQSSLETMLCLKTNCQGHYQPDVRSGLAYYRDIYRNGQVARIVASEHTGLLSRTNRENLEKRFIESDRSCDPNLISATSTLEMGINIGDLSSVILSSVPPGTANFQQRIGRAGRRDGNALVSVIANGKPHDLYFYANPKEMLAGQIEAAGCYLDASAILQRQLTAFCLDSWIATGITRQEFPPRLNDALNALERRDHKRFPYNWLRFIQDHQGELFETFIQLFESDTENQTQTELRIFIDKGEHEEGGLSWRILDRLEGVRKERTRLHNQIKNIGNRITKIKAEPEALQDPERLQELSRERSGFRALMKDLTQKPILNFLTDEGLLPNYAFPEAGVTLRSILWRRKQDTDQGDGKKYETYPISYERPGQLAIRELVPSGIFYAEGRRVKIDQIDLKLSEPEDWRLCRSCNYSLQNFEPEAQQRACPRCGDGMWSDAGQIRRMLRLRQVMATTSDKNS